MRLFIMRTHKKYYYLFFGITLLLGACNKKTQFPQPDIVNDNIILSGVVLDDRLDKEDNPLPIEISFFNPVSGKRKSYNITTNKKGKFDVRLPVEINPALAFFNLGYGEYFIMAPLIVNENNFIRIRFDRNGNMTVKLRNSIWASSYDMTEAGNMYMEMEANPCAESNPSYNSFYNKSLEDYTNSVYENINCRISATMGKFPHISKPTKEILIREFRFSLLRSYMFHYGEYVLTGYRNTYSEELWDNYIAPLEPEKCFYVFFKELNLNDKKNLLPGEAFNNMLNCILSNATLGIQEISDKPIKSWIKETAEILGELVGFEEGFFYDYLALRSYMRQFEYQTKPLTEVQRQNINSHFVNKAIPEIIFRENERNEKLSKFIGVPVINQTPDCPVEHLLETIILKHKGKKVFVDFWATWCGACIDAIDDIKELKKDIHDKNMVFVYFTNTSSPKNQWEKRIQGIGGEHYYLSKKQWDYLLNQLDFSSIPTYLLFDREGVLKEKVTGYTCNDDLRKILLKF
ncbi:MAG: TlpA family protein disulfide reductase [Bacteroidales bacterium]|jgi:thiol-disulfide isomerase/thioredoxin|nr:TlpA family protein disulfide reductase [Bacteroidales bacterium]